MDQKTRILISGAGVAGLTAAIWLGKAGFRPLIVERAPKIRADGFILSLSHHSYHLLRGMGILDDLLAVNNQVRSSSYHDRSGRAILTLDYERLFEAGNIIQVMRDDLEQVLYKHAKDNTDFLFANSVTELQQVGDEVEVTFEDGQKRTFDLVIGADGVHSAIRKCTFGPEEVTRHYLGLHAAAYRCENVLGISHKYEAYLEPNRHTIVYTTRKNDLACIFIWKNSALTVPPPGPEQINYLSEIYRGADSRAVRLIKTLKPHDRIYMEALTQIEMPAWCKGRVAIVGDAAHSLTQLSGQGASMAIRGASTLARALIDRSADHAFANYEATIRPIISEIQPAVRKNKRWYVPGSLAYYLFRDATMRFLPNEIWVRYFQAKYSKG